MTREEAIALLKSRVDLIKSNYPEIDDYCEALEMAIQAIQTLEQEPCGKDINVPAIDAISRQAVLDAMYALCDTGESLKENPWRDNPHIVAITDAIDNLPPVTPQPKTGHWIIIDDCERFIAKCSECGRIEDSRMISKYSYCHCGAKMIDTQESEE